MLNVIYLGAKKHRIDFYGMYCKFTYNDIVNYKGIDIVGDMCKIDLSPYDIIICTPPCNYYSRANYRRGTSKVAQETKYILPTMLRKLEDLNKPFIIENTCSRFCPYGMCHEYYYGGHIFYTNIGLPMWLLPKPISNNIQNKSYGNRDDNPNVHNVINLFLSTIFGEL